MSQGSGMAPREAHNLERSGSIPAPATTLADERLEQSIEATRQALIAAKTPAIRRDLAEQMRQLIGQRSPWKIAQMEEERGLR